MVRNDKTKQRKWICPFSKGPSGDTIVKDSVSLLPFPVYSGSAEAVAVDRFDCPIHPPYKVDWLRLMIAGCCLVAAAIATPVCAATWATGVALQKRLAGRVNVVCSGQTFRTAAEELGKLHSVAVLIDRRIDPGNRVDLTIDQTSLAEAFEKLAAKQKLSFGMVGPVAYFGPPGAASRLRTLAAIHLDELKTAPEAVRRHLLQTRPMAWKDFATPRELLAELAKQGNLKVDGLDRVPHDLWAAADLPPLPLLDRLLLVSMQFELDFRIGNDGVIHLVAAPEKPALVRQYDAGRDAAATIERFAALAPGAEIKEAGGKIEVRGSLDDHQRLAAPPQTPKHPATPAKGGPAKVKIDKLTVQNKPLGPVLEQLGARLNLDLEIDKQAIADAGISLNQLVSVDVKNVSVDELLRQLLRATGLTFRREGDTVVIEPK